MSQQNIIINTFYSILIIIILLWNSFNIYYINDILKNSKDKLKESIIESKIKKKPLIITAYEDTPRYSVTLQVDDTLGLSIGEATYHKYVEFKGTLKLHEVYNNKFNITSININDNTVTGNWKSTNRCTSVSAKSTLTQYDDVGNEIQKSIQNEASNIIDLKVKPLTRSLTLPISFENSHNIITFNNSDFIVSQNAIKGDNTIKGCMMGNIIKGDYVSIESKYIEDSYNEYLLIFYDLLQQSFITTIITIIIIISIIIVYFINLFMKNKINISKNIQFTIILFILGLSISFISIANYLEYKLNSKSYDTIGRKFITFKKKMMNEQSKIGVDTGDTIELLNTIIICKINSYINFGLLVILFITKIYN
jgi:hypothetical protein